MVGKLARIVLSGRKVLGEDRRANRWWLVKTVVCGLTRSTLQQRSRLVTDSATDDMRAEGFRSDIEGLRAICVAAVVLYHAKLPGFAGGFIGVDVFFVLSGYLIAGLLLRELHDTGRIDLIGFWTRRARRLLPNALLTIAAVVAVGMFVQPLLQHISTQGDAIAAVFYLANYRFADRAVDYFDHDLQASPLLHFWSLSIEEQFYIGLPLTLVALLGFRRLSSRSITVLFATIVVVSFGVMLMWLTRNQPRGFFDSEARVWQLAIGGLLASAPRCVPSWPPNVRASLAWAGLLGIVACVATYSDALTYPGWWSLVPTISAVALLVGGNVGACAPQRILSLAPLQWLGRRSYSIYLWHWPILVLLPLAFPGSSHLGSLALLLIVPIAALVFTWVEEPIRRFRPGDKAVRRALGATASAFACIVLLVVCMPMLDTGRDSYRVAQLASLKAAKTDGPRILGCPSLGWGEAEIHPCTFGQMNAPRTVLLFGDSHAEHLFDGVNAAARGSGWQLRVWTKPSCPPVDVPLFNVEMRAEDVACSQWRENVIERLIREKPDLVLLASWTGVATKMHAATTGARLQPSQSLDIWKAGFARVVRRLRAAGLKVVVVRDTPRSRPNYGDRCLETHPAQECVTPRGEAIDREMPDVFVATTVKGASVLDLTDYFCGPNTCPPVVDGAMVYRGDGNHLTATFSLTLAPAFAQLLASSTPAADSPVETGAPHHRALGR